MPYDYTDNPTANPLLHDSLIDTASCCLLALEVLEAVDLDVLSDHAREHRALAVILEPITAALDAAILRELEGRQS